MSRLKPRNVSIVCIGLVVALVILGGFDGKAESGFAPPVWADAADFVAPSNYRSDVQVSAIPPGVRTRVCPASSRSFDDRRDQLRGPQVHIVYLVAADSVDEGLDRYGTLNCSVQAWNHWFAQQSGGLSWRVDTYGASVAGARHQLADITFVQSDRPGSELTNSSQIEAELEEAGLDDEDKIYVSYVAADAGALCGSGRYPVLDLSDPAHPFGGHGRFAQSYLFSDPNCHSHEFGIPGRPGWGDAIPLHELIHTEGVVPIGAPHGCSTLDGIPTHVCTPGLVFSEAAGLELDPERTDLMFPFVTEPLSGLALDRGHDDYFGHSWPLLRDLRDSPYLEN